jgi:hypothetical protein
MEAVGSSEALLITYHTAWYTFLKAVIVISFFVAPFITDLTLYCAVTEVAAVWLGCGQQTAKKNLPLSNFMQIQEMIPELWRVWTDSLGFHN